MEIQCQFLIYNSDVSPLKLAVDKELHNIHHAVNGLADDFSLSDDEKSKLLPSGQQPAFYNCVGWARTYLKKAGLIEDPR